MKVQKLKVVSTMQPKFDLYLWMDRDEMNDLFSSLQCANHFSHLAPVRADNSSKARYKND
jgi:hypothetical protein